MKQYEVFKVFHRDSKGRLCSATSRDEFEIIYDAGKQSTAVMESVSIGAGLFVYKTVADCIAFLNSFMSCEEPQVKDCINAEVWRCVAEGPLPLPERFIEVGEFATLPNGEVDYSHHVWHKEQIPWDDDVYTFERVTPIERVYI